MKIEDVNIKEQKLLNNILNYNISYGIKLSRKLKLNKIIHNNKDVLLEDIHNICINKNVFILDAPSFIFNNLKTMIVNTHSITLNNFLLKIQKDIMNLYFIYIFKDNIFRYCTYHIDDIRNDIESIYINKNDYTYIINDMFIKQYNEYINQNIYVDMI